MKNIKFRAWDKKLNVMWEPIELVKLLKYLTFQQMPNADAYMAFKDHPNDLVWLEFTGLTDKNGKDIYEGDIVRKLASGWASKHLGTPEQRAMTLEEYLISISQIYEVKYVFDRFRLENNNYMDSFGTGDHGFIEVIGNIYENKELLS